MSIPEDPLKGLGITPVPQPKTKTPQEPLSFGPPPPTEPKVQKELEQGLKERDVAQKPIKGLTKEFFQSVAYTGK